MKILILLLCALYAKADNVYSHDATNTLANRQTMVHLFEWKWTDIAKECENFLQYNGYGAVQISPPNEHIKLTVNNDMPWYIRYQPVSYKLQSRSGSPEELQDMINRCNKVGVRIIVDVVMNHMVGVGEKKGVNGVDSSDGSYFDGSEGIENFPVYSHNDFNDYRCDGNIQGSDYQNNAANVKNCRLVGLLDLNQGSSYVRSQLVGYLNNLIDMGVAGFRCDASKHMWPGDLAAILSSTKNLRSDIFGSNKRAFVVHEVIDRGGEAVKCTDYLTIGRYTNFNFGAAVSSAAKGQSDWKFLSGLGPGFGYGNNEDHDVLNFIDNHDNQRDSNPYVVTYKNGDQYRMAVSFMLAWPYGYPRVMSSYLFNSHDQGPPNAGASNGYATTSPYFNPDNTCNTASGWQCEHRWPTIREMAKFRSVTSGTAVTEIFTDYNRIGFARNGKGFFALNGQSGTFSKYFQTTLPAGDYCDQYNGHLDNGKCTGEKITVNGDGTAFVRVPGKSIIAFSFASKIGGAPSTNKVIPSSWSKTVIFLKKDTQPGQNLFVRGGKAEQKCSTGPYQQSTDPCAIPIIHNTSVPFEFAEYLTWSQMDNYLDFEGAEAEQGTHDGQVAAGTPLAYSTNDKNAVEYQPLNKYGPGYWMVQMYMDCTKVEQGWFDLKGYLTPSVDYEPNINQGACGGSKGGSAPFSSINHIARCGAVNVFTFGDSSCIIDSF